MHLFHEDGTLPDSKSVFVFGSNLAGLHGAGAAKAARERFGAVQGQGTGRQGQSYAIPSKDGRPGTPALSDPAATLPLSAIIPEVAAFIEYAREHSTERFFISRIGCGLAGYRDEDIAPLFVGAPCNCSFPVQWKQWLLQPHSAIGSK